MGKRSRVLAAALGCVAAVGTFVAFETIGDFSISGGGRPVKVPQTAKSPSAAKNIEATEKTEPQIGCKAFLVGADAYDDVAQLRCVKNDVEALARRLVEIGADENNVTVLKTGGKSGDIPTKAQIEARFETFVDSLEPGDFAVVFLSGHGFQADGETRETFFAPVDANPRDLFGSSVSIDKMLERLDKSRAKSRWLIVDACRNVPEIWQTADVRTRTLGGAKGLTSPINAPESTALLQSCQQGEVSYEADEHGFFTRSLLEALDKNDSKADKDGDGVLYFTELIAYVTARTDALAKERVGVSQKPSFSGKMTDFAVLNTRIEGLPPQRWREANALYEEAAARENEGKYSEALDKIRAAREINSGNENYKNLENRVANALKLIDAAALKAQEEAAQAEAELKKQLEAERKAREEAEKAAAQAEAERKAREEAAQAEAERKAREEAEKAAAQAEAERKAREEAAQAEAERKAKEEAEALAAAQKAQEEAAQAEAELKKQLETERKAREEAEKAAAQAEAERKAREEAAQAEAERKAKEEAEALAAANSAETFYRCGREAAFGLKGKIDAELGFHLLQEAANQGSTDAMGALAVLYRDGCAATPPNSAKALELMKKTADAENPWGQYLLALCYLTGAGVEKDKTRADALFEAARAGFAELADEDPLASTYLGRCYAVGRGGAKDCDEAARRFREAAETGCVDAMICLAGSYSFGQGVARDAKQAFEWFRQSAEAGNAVAMRELGVCYENGFGVAKDAKKAFEWYEKSAEAGALAAAFNLELCYANGIGVEKDDEKAFEWRQKGAEASRQSAEAGNLVAMYALGWCYANGFGVEKNETNAFEWCRKGAEAGNPNAMRVLGWCYENGFGVEKNETNAFEWYRKGAEAGEPFAMRALGWCYANGFGVEKNETNAFEWYRKGAEAGNPGAMDKLGYCYENGVGAAKNLVEAEHWYRKAMEFGPAEAINAEAGLERIGRWKKTSVRF